MSRLHGRMRDIVLLVMIGLSAVAFAGKDEAKSKLSGYALFDFFYNAQHPNEDANGVFGSKIRRVYFTYDYAVKPHYKARVRLEANDGVLMLLPKAIHKAEASGDATALDAGAAKPSLILKDAYMQWDITADWAEQLNPSLIFGIQSTPAFGQLEEKAWKYRSLEKTLLDLRKIASSRDLGIGVKGSLGDSGFGYRFLVGNDTTKAETNKEKRYYGVVSYTKDALLGEVYGHFRQLAGDSAEYAAKVFAGYQASSFAVHATAVGRWTTNTGPNSATRTTTGISVFGRYRVGDETELVARADRFDPDTNAENDASILLLLGLAYRPNASVAFIPNIWVNIPQDADTDPTIVPRLTVHYRF